MKQRLIRLKDAPAYLAMDRKVFAKDVRPFIPEIRIGIQGVAFDRLDLDAWIDHHKLGRGCSITIGD